MLYRNQAPLSAQRFAARKRNVEPFGKRFDALNGEASRSLFYCLVRASILVATVLSPALVVTLTKKPAFKSSSLQILPSQVIDAVGATVWVISFLPSLSVMTSLSFAALTILPSWLS